VAWRGCGGGADLNELFILDIDHWHQRLLELHALATRRPLAHRSPGRASDIPGARLESSHLPPLLGDLSLDLVWPRDLHRPHERL
jgi:hypothetical protein